MQWLKKKFGVEIEPVVLASKILEGAAKLKDIRPLILKKEFPRSNKIKKYFEREAQNYLRKKISKA